MPIFIETRIQWKKRTKKMCDSNLSLASIDNPAEARNLTIFQNVHVVELNHVSFSVSFPLRFYYSLTRTG